MIKKILLTLTTIVVIAVGVIAFCLVQFFRPAGNAKEVVFTIEQGEGVHVISRNLKQAGLIDSSFIFESYIWLLRTDQKIIAGRYQLNRNLNIPQITKAIMAGPDQQPDQLTFIEGWNRHEYADVLTKAGFHGDAFLTITASSTLWRDDYQLTDAVPLGHTLEGFLFPDTYQVARDSDEITLVSKMLANFERKVTPQMIQDMIKQNRSLYEVITMASIIEKEVPQSGDKKMIADIFWKRIKAGIGLQSDATVNFAQCLTAADVVNCEKTTRPSLDDLQLDSPYNTYKYKGLPPGPISNPGLESIQAALYPTPNPYYYFLTDLKGKVYYARNLEEHKKNRELYLGR
jgi:UPF0755 protein